MSATPTTLQYVAPALEGPALLASSVQITRIGVEAETDPIFVDEVVVEAQMEKDKLEDVTGTPAFWAWGNHRAQYNVRCVQLAQYGASDAFPGRLSGNVLANLRPAFGVRPASGLFLLTRGQVTRQKLRLPTVDLTFEVEGIDHSIGSPDGPSTPGVGGTTVNTPPVFGAMETIEGQIGVALTAEIDLTGTGTITWALADVSNPLPDGLSLSTYYVSGVQHFRIIGTPTGEASSRYVVFTASNAYGQNVMGTVAVVIAPVATETPVEWNYYALYLYDSGDPEIPDEYWVIADDADNEPDDFSEWAGPPTETYSLVGTPDFPRALDGTVAGRDFQLVEIIRRRFEAPAEWEYFYRRDPQISRLMASITAGLDPVVANHMRAPQDIDIGEPYVPPTTEAFAWPGIIAPDPRWNNYILFGNLATGRKYVTRQYAVTLTSLSDFLTHFSVIIGGSAQAIFAENPDELSTWYPIEIIGGDGTSYYRKDAAVHPMQDLYDAGKSPWWYLPLEDGTVIRTVYNWLVGFPSQAVPTLLTPATGGDPLPTPVGTFPPGLPPSASINWYILRRSRVTNQYICSGYNSRWVPTIADWCNGFTGGGITKGPDLSSWVITDQAGEWIIVEIFYKGVSLSLESADGYYYKYPGWPYERIAQCLAHGVSPVGHPFGGTSAGLLL